jgi:septal ring factor EnvC (AmiA/AmiB activator)
MLLADITPALQAEAEALKAELEEVALLRSLQEGAAETLEDGLRGAQEARTALSRAIAERTDLPRRFSDDPEALAAILQSADTLESFAQGLLAVPLSGAESGGLPFAGFRGSLPYPVMGEPLRAFEEPDAAGISRPGLILAARPFALVAAPAAGTVRYAGPLLDYGNVIVLEPEAGYLLVLAGLGELYAEEGEVIPAGVPLALMGGAEPEAAEFLGGGQDGGGAELTETLYIEVRENGAPVDPALWFSP